MPDHRSTSAVCTQSEQDERDDLSRKCLNGVGSPTRARTWDLRINSPSLYQLSYRGIGTNEVLLKGAILAKRRPLYCLPSGSMPVFVIAANASRDERYAISRLAASISFEPATMAAEKIWCSCTSSGRVPA